MLELLNKITSRILAKRLTLTLPTVIGDHPHGFMAGGRDILQPTVFATNLIQDAQHNHQGLQLVSLNIGKAFDHIGKTTKPTNYA
jgi:hypothetical protein